LIRHLANDAPIILADMGAISGQVTHEWFYSMFKDVAATGVTFTAIDIDIDIRTTMNIYGDVVTDEMGQAHSKVVGLALSRPA